MKQLILLAALIAAPALADERDFCPERPGLNTPPCIVDKGHISIETSLADWTIEKQGRDRTDTVLVADTLARIGVSDTIEARIGWTPLGHQYERGGGSVDRVGDVTLGLKTSLFHPDGKGFSLAVLPYVALPVGRQPIGAGDWGGGVLLPLSYDLSDKVQFAATGEVDAAVDGDGDGRHLAYSGTLGLNFALSEAVTLTGEGEVEGDRDPGGHTTQALAALSLAVKAGKNLQFDVQGTAGLNHDTPDVEMNAGFAVRL